MKLEGFVVVSTPKIHQHSVFRELASDLDYFFGEVQSLGYLAKVSPEKIKIGHHHRKKLRSFREMLETILVSICLGCDFCFYFGFDCEFDL